MSIEKILDRLNRVTKTGHGRWRACCPAHDDKNPSLLLKQNSDGKIGLQCFAGCDGADVLAAIGLTFKHLYPPHLQRNASPHDRTHFNAMDILRCVGHEALVAAVAASNLRNGETLSEKDFERLLLAARRLRNAAEVARHGV